MILNEAIVKSVYDGLNGDDIESITNSDFGGYSRKEELIYAISDMLREMDSLSIDQAFTIPPAVQKTFVLEGEELKIPITKREGHDFINKILRNVKNKEQFKADYKTQIGSPFDENFMSRHAEMAAATAAAEKSGGYKKRRKLKRNPSNKRRSSKKRKSTRKKTNKKKTNKKKTRRRRR